MNPVETFEVGIAPEHIPALLAVILLPVMVMLSRRLRTPLPADLGMAQPTATGTPGPTGAGLPGPTGTGTTGLGGATRSHRPALTLVTRCAAWALGLSAAVHIGLPLGEHDRPVLVIGFLAIGVAFAWVAMRVVEGRPWRLWSALLFTTALLAYGLVSVSGVEPPDQVGLVTVMVELAGLGLSLVPSREPGRPRRFARFAGSTGTVVAALLVGIMAWIGTFAAHAGNDDVTVGGTNAAASVHVHTHALASRSQAGIVVREPDATDATPAQQQAAAQLAAQVRQGTARFADLDAALAAGYELPAVREGMAVHLDNKTYKSDGRVLDPQRPETLVYAISAGRATLLGALFVMELAGRPGPAVGGPITHWHAHNLCVTGLPVGFGVVTPFGGCTALAVNITTPEMMHVWVVDNPKGAFADDLDDTWVRAYHAEHGMAYSRR